MKKPNFIIPDWRPALSHYSTKALALGAAIQAAWAVMPDDFKAGLGQGAVTWIAWATAAILAFGLVGKFIEQP